MSSMQPSSTSRVVLGLGVLALVVLVVLVQRPAGDTGADQPSATPDRASTSTSAPAAPAVATDEDFCAGFRALADGQAQYVSGATDEAALQEAADALVATGVPAGMSLPARSGYFGLISSVYDSIGLDLEPAAVGATTESVEGGDAAFSAYLQQACPP